jgi:hypothetical protein
MIEKLKIVTETNAPKYRYAFGGKFIDAPAVYSFLGSVEAAVCSLCCRGICMHTHYVTVWQAEQQHSMQMFDLSLILHRYVDCDKCHMPESRL